MNPSRDAFFVSQQRPVKIPGQHFSDVPQGRSQQSALIRVTESSERPCIVPPQVLQWLQRGNAGSLAENQVSVSMYLGIQHHFDIFSAGNDRVIRQRPEIPLQAIPKSRSKKTLTQLISVLKSHITARLIEDQSGTFERAILTHSYYSMEGHENGKYRFTRMDKAAYSLGMSKEAFDLLVAANSDLFRKIARYDGKWYVPELYLNKLREEKDFVLIKSKYELLANQMPKRPFSQ